MRPFNQRGAVATEFALVVPIIVTLFVAIIDLTAMMTDTFDTNQAARDGAQLAANTLLQPGDDETVIEQAGVVAAQTVLAAAGRDDCDAGVSASWYDEDDRWFIRVDVVCPYTPMILKGTTSITAQFTMVTQQQGLVEG